MTTDSIVQRNLPDILETNEVFSILSEQADQLPQLVALMQAIFPADQDAFLVQSLDKTPAQWVAQGVSESVAEDLTSRLANWLCKAVGAVDGKLFLLDWDDTTKLTIAQEYLRSIVPLKSTYRGLTNCLELFQDLGLWSTYELRDVAPNFFDLDVHIPRVQVGIDTWQEIPDRNSLAFRTLRLLLDFHNPLGVGLVWADWTNNGADYSLAEDSCV